MLSIFFQAPGWIDVNLDYFESSSISCNQLAFPFQNGSVPVGTGHYQHLGQKEARFGQPEMVVFDLKIKTWAVCVLTHPARIGFR